MWLKNMNFEAVSDEVLGTFVPIIVYWIYSGMYILLELLLGEKYRLHSKNDENEKNVVPKRVVIKGVLIQQFLQAMVAITCYMVIGNDGENVVVDENSSSLINLIRQFFIAMVVLDTMQYFMHRFMHQNKFMYKHIHSQHHRLIVPYAFGALYNHPLEGLFVDTFSGALAFLVSGMSPRASIFFYTFATIKAVDDHCGICLPWNIFHVIFKNNTAYHDIHHQFYGNKYNFSQPFFVMWDKLLGTYMPYSVEKRVDGGLEARPVVSYKCV
ncbi:sphinganine C4-monooxygenase 1-like [Humulus lupulus]|uniref:sphinganine C4-monooxygenase 1-like n=1 Tax=Humulus lupulus TaxID=3486 RepID=UPI002B414599|nr:sphinganine C4-monooxygenase 1-like [Humulus lupulus]